MTNTISLAHAYGLSNGLFLSAFIFMVFFGLSYYVSDKDKKVGKLFLFFSLGFLAFFLFNLLFQHSQSTVASQSTPAWLLFIAKFSAPLGLIVFSKAFVKISVMHSSAAYEAYQQKRHVLHVMYLINGMFVVALFFISSIKIILFISLLCVIPLLALAAWYLHVGLRNILSNIFVTLIGLTIVFMMYLQYLIFIDDFVMQNQVILPMLTFFSLFIMAISFSSIRFTYFEALKYHEVHRIDEKNLLNDILKATQKDEFFMVYQPQVSPETGSVTGVEALIRWQHPVHGLIPPNEFIPIAEKTGMINEICKWTIVSVMKQQQTWLSKGLRVPVSLNLSVANLNHNIADFILANLKKYDLPAELLCFEITESLFLDFNNDVEGMLLKLRNENITLSIDDYGTGFSSLSYLKKLSLSELKIDRSFIYDLDTNAENLVIVQSIFYMCQGLGLKIVAEGVENQDIIDILKDMKCDSLQGYGIAKPMNISALEAWLETQQIACETNHTTPNTSNTPTKKRLHTANSAITA